MNAADLVAAALLGGLQFLGLRRWLASYRRSRRQPRQWWALAAKLDDLENRRRPSK